MSRTKKEANSFPEKKSLPHGWVALPSKTHPKKVYYYNTVTQCSTWTNPSEVAGGKKASTPNKSDVPCQKNDNFKRSKRKRQKKVKMKAALLEKSLKEMHDQQDCHTDNVSHKPSRVPHSNLTSPPSTSKSFPSFNFATPLENSALKKSAVQNDTPSTSRSVAKKKIFEREEKSAYSTCATSKTNNWKIESLKNQESKETYGRIKSFGEIKEKDNVEKSPDTYFTRKDKTPAQTRLLKLRQQNLETAKLMLKNQKNIEFDSNYKKKSGESSKNFKVLKKSESKNVKDSSCKKSEICNNFFQETGNCSKDDFIEEMDWEPCNEELVVRNINLFRQQHERATEVSQDFFFSLNSNSSCAIAQDSHLCLLVLDTNIFVSCLNFVKELRDTKIAGINYPVIYVPWTVLRELDHLKDTRIDEVNKKLHSNVRRAITYLNDNFKSGHPRCVGQSLEDFSKMVDSEAYAPDDEILQTSIKLQKLYPDTKIVLLTNDKNLESKAIISGMEAYSKDGFHKKYLSSESVAENFNTAKTFHHHHLRVVKVDNILCEVKKILKSFINLMVETEMKIAFDDDWVKLAFKKPPWTLQDAFDCLIKHWRSVFFVIFSKDTLHETEKLYEMLFVKEATRAEDVSEIIYTIRLLLSSIKRSQKNRRSYLDLIDTTVSNLCGLLKDLSSNNPTQADGRVAASVMNQSLFYTEQISHEELYRREISKMENLFCDIWNFFKNFWQSISDIIHSSVANIAVQEIRLKLILNLNQIGEFVLTVDKILETSSEEISEHHPLINHLSNFLVHLCPAMEPDLSRRLPKSLTAFFRDFNARSLMSRSLNDLRELSGDLLKAREFFESQSPF